jgi:hypothetical protein
MRISLVIAALAVAAPLTLSAGPASAQFFQGQTWWGGRPNTPKGAWCLNANTGAERVEEDCSFNSLAACQFARGNPNNGFCTRTSAYAPPPPAQSRRKKRRAQY